jgi:hypothetical protein
MSDSEYTLIFGLGPKNDGTPNSDVDLAVALAAIEDAILMVSGSYRHIEQISAVGKRLLGRTAIYVKKPDGSTILL